jgi:hypothetical protein
MASFTFFSVKMWQIFAFSLKNAFGQFVALHFSASDKIRH